jgi:hypothetical protein
MPAFVADFNQRVSHWPRGACHAARLGSVLALWIAATLCGCASTNWVKLREAPRTPLVERLNLVARGGPKPTDRTMQFLRRYDLVVGRQP